MSLGPIIGWSIAVAITVIGFFILLALLTRNVGSRSLIAAGIIVDVILLSMFIVFLTQEVIKYRLEKKLL